MAARELLTTSDWGGVAAEKQTYSDLNIELLTRSIQGSSGFLIDYIYRCKRVLHSMRTTRCTKMQGLRKFLGVQSMEDFGGFKHAGVVVLRENLQSTLMEAITKESKLRKVFPRLPVTALRDRAARIRKIKREVMCLRVEVENWQLRRNLLHNHVRQASSETIWERKHRLEEFWTLFHDRTRGNWGEGSSPLAATLRGDGEELEQGGLLLRSTAPPHGISPKYGMRWSPEQASKQMRWQLVEPSPGTLANMQLQSSGLLPVPGRDFNNQTGIRKASSLPSLHPPQHPRPREPTKAAAAAGAGEPSAAVGRAGQSSPSGAGPGLARTVELPPIGVSRHRYLQECEVRQKVPTPMAFMTGHSNRLAAAGRDLVDTDLLAVAGMLQESRPIEEVNLHDNSMLTDKGLVPLLQELTAETAAGALQSLDLGRCVHAGLATLHVTVRLLGAATGLCHLDLSHVPLAARLQLPMCQAIGGHPRLHRVSLAETGLGRTYQGRDCVAALLRSRRIQVMDLGWNCFTAEVFARLGECLAESQALRSLCVANSAAVTDEVDTPVAFFLEWLAHDHTLTCLDISMNRIDFRAALTLEDSLDSHRRLTDLSVSNNPLGVLGMRSALRLLSRARTGLVCFNTENCYSGSPNEDPDSADGQVFCATNPGGRYMLNLARPYHRALLRMLYKTTDRFQLHPDQTFQGISFQPPPPYAHPAKDARGIWQVPTSGLLGLTFNIERALDSAVRGLADSDFPGVLRRHYELTRFRPGWKKVVPLFAKWRDLDGHSLEQQVFLGALSKDFNLTLPYLEYMCLCCRGISSETIWRLLPCIVDDPSSIYLGQLLFQRLNDFLTTHRKMEAFCLFNVENPTGHYRLDLGNCSDYGVAERLLLIDRWEAAVDRRQLRFDTSSRGNGSHLRNEVYQGRPLHLRYASVAEWKMPENSAEFEADYISNQRPPKDAQVLSDGLWEEILVVMHRAPCSADEKVTVLRGISHNFYLTSMHMRQMLGFFRTKEQRAEAFIIFYLRIVDMHNSKLFRVRFKQEEIRSLEERVGFATFFPFLQPENARFALDVSFHDRRLCASMFVALSLKEKVSNIQEPEFVYPDGTVDPFTVGVPRSWENFEKMPRAGVFRGSYVCAPEDRKYDLRRRLAETYGFFNVDVAEDDVKWWTGLMEPPPDVIDLLEFFIGRVSHVDEAFRIIDGPNGNGVITLKEFREGLLTDMKCTKFKGKDELQRLDAIFRYLDPGGEGSISLGEWRLLDQLWKEFDLSIREFVQFLMLTFGDALEVAWESLDDDGSGELTRQEWLAAVARIGYFGPSEVVFALLDYTDDGNISINEFEVLNRYKPERKQQRRGALVPRD